ncbi:ribosomal RNA small subunit methyltransferase I [Terrihabitans soli]|uniref:Ribosomal RNA small subunit methyltransferase I n=2 Tax=Terrihabitans soli TaxID=708113 RepID=A0A6S6QYP0_9HYPH|nr:16S rRNA (cytidine(1402)-2'-O)-methyltransferase [Terrihabitans soli]BCJ92151.1 ribosomal RNA small subunit methyltransferase I [Terrihabitans soli]
MHVVATPIGNLGDITVRALEVLAGVDAILAEDSRVTRKLLSHYGISKQILPYHEHNAAEMRPKIIARLKAGEALALVSDAGTPLISDPGFKLVRALVDEDLPVTALPGPSSLLTGLVLAGLPTDRFFFEGFLPPKSAARRTRGEELRAVPGTLVFFETGPRLAASLADLAAVLGPRDAAVARELTKHFEEVRRGSLNELAEFYADAERAPKGEIVLLVAPPDESEGASEEDIDTALKTALKTSSLKDAVAEVTKLSGAPKRDVYQRALALSKNQ